MCDAIRDGIARIGPERAISLRAVPPQVLEETPTTALVTGNWALGQVTGNFAVDLAIAKAKKMAEEA